MSRQSWSSQEDQAITKLVKEYGIQDWTKIAFKLRDYLGMQKRTGKQCRERWYNHLSPTVSKKPWTQEEQQLLFNCHKNFGNRWKDISKLFIGRYAQIYFRTDNDIKNHFYSTLRRSLRRLNKIVGEKNSTTQMREIKPSVLSTIMNYIYQQQQYAQLQLLESLKALPILIFEFATFKPIKINLKNANIESLKQKTNQIFSLISRFNEQYQRNKAFRRNLKFQKLRKKSSYQQSAINSQFQVKIEKNSSNQYYDNQAFQQSNIDEQEICVNEVKIEQQQQVDIFAKNIDIKLTNTTQFTINPHQESHQQFNHLPLNLFQQSWHSSRQNIKYTNQSFSLQADEINDLHFHQPQQPSRLNIQEHEYMRCMNESDLEKEKYHQSEIIDQVIEAHFST